jgi:TatD DNase family protein
MNLIDTHTHLYLKDFSSDLAGVMERAECAGVSKFYMPAIDSNEVEAMRKVESLYPGRCLSMAGLHPCSVKEDFEAELEKISLELEQRKFAAIGESGLDLYWDTTFVREQYISLERQIQWALQYHLPLVLHTRNATRETIEVISAHRGKGLKGIFHCFGGSLQEARDIIRLGFFLGIGGVVTFKNSGLAEVLQEIELNSIVLETDAPYLAPVPFRGKRNESSYLTYIVDKIAAIKNRSTEAVALQTTKNAAAIFPL